MKSVTITEIENQFKTWLKVDDLILEYENIISEVLEYVDDQTMIVFTGAGTSGYIGDQLVTYLNEKRDIANYISYYSTNIVGNPEMLVGGKRVLLVSFARSGNSPESVEAVRLVNQYAKHCKHLIITCNSEGSLATSYPESSIILPNETNDEGFAMTNSYSTMMITAAKIFGIEFDLERVVYEAKRIYYNFPYDKVGDFEYENIVYLANSENVGLLNELKLKFMELTNGRLGYYSDQFLNFRHGPKSVITKKSMVIMLLSDDELQAKYELDLVEELLNDENKPSVITFGNCNLDTNVSVIMNVDGLEKALVMIPTCQRLAVNKSISMGINPDNPSPSGSVNRVVQGVKIYRRDDVS